MATTITSTSLDFTSIKNNLKTYLANKEEFKDYNFEASGLSNILDVLAYNTHINGLIANFSLNESYLSTAQLRSSVVSLAEGVGYIPDSETASRADVRIFFSTSTTPRDTTIALPAYTQFTTTVDDVSYVFSTISTFYATDNGSGFYEFQTSDGSNQIPIFQGTQKVKNFLVGEVLDNPVYIIPDKTIDISTVRVRVYTTAAGSSFTTFQNIINATSISAASTIYILKESPNGFYELGFGDGVSFGIAPAAGSRIEVTYLSTSGADANGASAFTPSAQLSTGGITTNLSTTTFNNSFGGKEKESIESIRKNAPFHYAAQNRMVTADDYSALILQKYSNLIKDISTFGGQDHPSPEFGAVFTSILFEDDVTESVISTTKLAILDLAKQLAVSSFNLRFIDPIKTFVELDCFYQFNPNLTDLSSNAVNSQVNSVITSYFNTNTGSFKQSFRRSNLLAEIDDLSAAILSSRADVRMQQRFTPTAPNLIAVINSLTANAIASNAALLDYVVGLVTTNRHKDAANWLVNNGYSIQNFTTTLDKLSNTKLTISQTLSFPVSIMSADDDEFSITSSQFKFNNVNCVIKNKLESSTLQIVQANGVDIINDNIGTFDANAGTVTINYFNPQSIASGGTQIKLKAVPANQSAIAPERNELLEYDTNESKVLAVNVSAQN